MSQPFVGEIRMFAGNFAPAGWMFLESQPLPISENETLFQLIGTTYGGDGMSTFALPDLRGRLPIHQGNGFSLAETGGVENVTLTASQIPAQAQPWRQPFREDGCHYHALHRGANLSLHERLGHHYRRWRPAALQPPALP